jgi:hypothetical protein
MRTDGSLDAIRRGRPSAIQPQPRRRHANEVWVGTPTRPWGSRRLPATLLADGPRRTTFRDLLRRAEGVLITLPDGSDGVVDEVLFAPFGFDFWPVALVVATAAGKLRVPAAAISCIDVREPRLWADAGVSRAARTGPPRPERARRPRAAPRPPRARDEAATRD